MIEIKRFPEQTIPHFDPDGNLIGVLNEIESNEVRIQIVEQGLEGYFIVFNGERITINRKGEFSQHPRGLYDAIMPQFKRLFEARRETVNKK